MTKKKKTTFSIGIVLLAMLIGLLIGVMTAPKLDASYWSPQQAETTLSQGVNTILSLVDNYYVDRVDYDSLSDKMMNAMLSTLDPHSCYLPPSDFEKEEEALRGSFEGVGIILYCLGDSVYASHVIPNTPAYKAGIRTGDRIMRVDTTLVSGAGVTQTISNVVNMIRGPRYSTVSLTIERSGSAKQHTYKMRRDVIHNSTVPAFVMVDKTTGYIRISHFGGSTATEFHAALLQLLKEGMQSLVLDLRDNGGGAMETAIEVCDELLPNGDLIVYTQGAHSRRSNIYATRGGLFEEGRLAILIDEGSASASEIVAGAVQDNDRGTIVGHRSFGKGLVQKQFPLTNGGAMRLTVARYYTPSGRCIQRPYDKGTDEYYSEYITRIIQNYVAADSILDAGFDTTQSFLTKKGRKVYGGGGIRPDIMLPYITDTNLVYYNRLIGQHILEDIAHRQLFERYDQLSSQYPDIDTFLKGYHVDDATWQSILTLADQRRIPRHTGSLNKYGNEIRNRYKAIMAMALFGENAYYKVSLPNDIELQKALQKLKNAK